MSVLVVVLLHALLLVGGTVLLLGSPVFLAIALAIKLRGGPGPIFYRQERISVDGKAFQMWKFRSMRVDAESDTGPVWAQAEDPRRTAIGIVSQIIQGSALHFLLAVGEPFNRQVDASRVRSG